MDRWRTRLLLAALLPLLAVAFLELRQGWQEITAVDEDDRVLMRPFLGMADTWCRMARELLLLVATALALLWRRTPASRRVLLLGWALTIALGFLPNLMPWTWRYRSATAHDPDLQAVFAKYAPAMALGILVDMSGYVPVTIVGLSRAGYALVRNEPGSPIGGLFVMISSMLLGSITALVFATLQPLVVAGPFLLGILAITLHCAVAILCGYRLALPAVAHRAPRTLLIASACTLLLGGAAAICWSSFDVEIDGKLLVAHGGREGYVDGSSVWQFALHVVAHGFTTAVVFADLIRRSLSAPLATPAVVPAVVPAATP
jgi:hypothetical protein